MISVIDWWNVMLLFWTHELNELTLCNKVYGIENVCCYFQQIVRQINMSDMMQSSWITWWRVCAFDTFHQLLYEWSVQVLTWILQQVSFSTNVEWNHRNITFFIIQQPKIIHYESLLIIFFKTQENHIFQSWNNEMHVLWNLPVYKSSNEECVLLIFFIN